MNEILADPELLHNLMAEQAAIGATPGGGLNRVSLSAADREVRDWFANWLKTNDFQVIVDPLGNVMGLLTLAGPYAPLVLSGSHLDSQPMGGRFDGAYGVVAACAASIALRDATRAGRIRPSCNLGVVSWTNEEGARFQPSLTGSSFHVEALEEVAALATVDGEGVRLGDELTAIGYRGHEPLPQARTYIELHIECSAELERAGRRLGVFTRWWGAFKAQVTFRGRQAHTGPTPMAERQDASYAAALAITGIRDLADEMNVGGQERLYSSAARIEIVPNSPNVVPELATLFIELRSPEPDVLKEAEERLHKIVLACANRARVSACFDAITVRPAGFFDRSLAELAHEVSVGLGHPTMELATVAGHDAIPLASRAKSIVIATPSVGGICHNENEFTEPADLELGLQLLTRMLARSIA